MAVVLFRKGLNFGQNSYSRIGAQGLVLHIMGVGKIGKSRLDDSQGCIQPKGKNQQIYYRLDNTCVK